MATRIGLIADTHIPEARATLWPQVYDAFEGVDCIFHGGDVHDLALLDELEKVAPVYCARGNGEDGSGGRPIQPEDPRVKYVWTVEIESLTVGLTHYIPVEEGPPGLTLERFVARYWPEKTPDVIVSGDSHTELIAEIDGILCVNPGSPTYPHNYDTQYGTIGFLDVEGNRADASVWLITDDGIEPFDWDAIPPWKLR
ncbi:MAG: YfcE family phosphodiesterase [Gammaproteobacteria bacterium]|nr:YfcE family phosphodiesterase [Gammaproteobacteria bacterium]MYF27646.1 YfcE family phosphodiesterase [Gammaproteobacteria bacterium]MYK47354.1 YfcE family phosphodiesterase [Gammaproteobacteria bacterium]